ncbi:MAG: cobyric acid synthase, partial [Acidimicrobiales bacterium]
MIGRPARIAGRPWLGQAPAITPPLGNPRTHCHDLEGALLVCGTGSDVGKSAFVTGLCRLLSRRRVSVAPFKAQNMSLNSWVTHDGAEIGRAQGVQAVAAGIPAEAVMNPVLLKPTGERQSQVIVLGEPLADLDVAAYQRAMAGLVHVVHDSLEDLRTRFDVVICEGAGSPAEINLLEHDIVNLRFAQREGLQSIVIGDIDRGGVLASLYGTVGLLPGDLRELIRGFVINKFRG